MKKVLTCTIITIVVGTIIFLIINNFIGKEETIDNSNSNSNIVTNEKDTVLIDFEMYQKLRSEVYENETFAILIMNSEDEVSTTFREEVLYSFKERSCLVYEIDTDKLSDVEFSELIRDVSDIQNYDEPTIMTPTLLISKKGKVVLVQEGLKYSNELIPKLDENEIE